MLKVSWCNRNKTNQPTHNRLLSHYCSRVWTSFYPPLSVLCMVSTDFQQKAFAKGEKSSENPFWLWTSINCGFSSSPYLRPSFPSSCPLSPPHKSPSTPSPRNDSSQLWSWCVNFILWFGSVRNGTLHHSCLFESVYFISEMFSCAFALLWLAEGERK